MLFFMHIELAKAIYQEIFASYDTGIEEQLFIYGNIKPDLMFVGEKSPHTSSHTMDKVKEKASLIISEDMSNESKSILYGEICHLICDYFCLYHADEKKYTKHLKHFFYEVIQYLKFSYKKLLGKNDLGDFLAVANELLEENKWENRVLQKYTGLLNSEKLVDIIIQNQQSHLYHHGNDLNIAFLNACCVCRYILAEAQSVQSPDIEAIPVFWSSAV